LLNIGLFLFSLDISFSADRI